MNNKINFHQIVDCLKEQNLSYGVLTLQNDTSIIISEYGGRIFGPFLSPESESTFWINQALAHPDSFEAFLKSGDWNLGGERIWIAPEIQYNVHDRTDFWNTYDLPKQVDPGQYALSQPKPNQWQLVQDINLKTYNLTDGQKGLHVEKMIHQVEDPLRHLGNYETLIEGLTFAGYEQVVSLSETESDDILTESWNSIQLNPGGSLLIPAAPGVEYSDYYAPIDEDYQTLNPNHICLKISGDRQYKVGYKAAQVFGRLAYYNHLEDGRAYLIARNFFNNPSAPYAEEPAALPGRRGHSIHVYNDDGGFGGFGELEVNGQTIGGDTGRSSSADQFVLWLYVGAAEKVKQLIPHLLGVSV